MGIIKLQEKERNLKYYWNAGRYYDYPDGQDLIGKLLFTNKIAALGGSFLGILYAINYHPVPPDFTGKALRYFRFLIPSLGVATVFTCVTYISTNIRKKDDAVNHVLGGLAAGPVLIPFSGYPSLGIIASMFFSGFAYTHKAMKMNNLEMLPVPSFKGWSSYYERVLDTSLEPKRKGNWTR